MIARGIDPGGTVGWCDVERVSAGVFRYLASGTWDAATVRRGVIPMGVVGIDVVAIETPEELHHSDVMAQLLGVASGSLKPGVVAANLSATVRHLLETRALAERIACSIVGIGARVLEPTAAEVRRSLGVKIGAQRGRGPKLTVDQQIAKIIPLAIRDWPARSNPHVRDAAAAAVWGLGGADVEAAVALALRGTSA